MHDPLDPYWQWLGIPPDEQPPDHYRLLGLTRFEDDRRLIEQAAEVRIEHVRSADDGSHPNAARRVVEHLAAAKDTLLNPMLKAQYDRLLMQKQSSGGAQGVWRAPEVAAPGYGTAAPAATSTAAPLATPATTSNVAVNIATADDERGRTAGQPGPSLASLVACGAAAALVAVLGLVLWLSPGSESQRAAPGEHPRARRSDTGPSGQVQASAPGFAEDHPGSDGRSPSRRSSAGPMMPRQPRGPQTMADLMAQADDAVDASTVTGKLAAARRAMWSRDLAAARRHIDAAAAEARTPTERTEVERVSKLLDSLAAFWTAVRQAAGRLHADHEIRVGDSMVMVVEAGGEGLVFRAAGENRAFRVEELPQRLAIAMAEQVLPTGEPATNLHVGSFLAIDRRGDRHDAQSRWERAGAEGRALLIELTLVPPVEPVEDGQTNAPESQE